MEVAVLMTPSEWKTARREFKSIFGFFPPFCKTLVLLKEYALDIFEFEKQIPGYDHVKCKYNGKSNYSIDMAVKEKYGEDAVKLIDSMI